MTGNSFVLGSGQAEDIQGDSTQNSQEASETQQNTGITSIETKRWTKGYRFKGHLLGSIYTFGAELDV